MTRAERTRPLGLEYEYLVLRLRCLRALRPTGLTAYGLGTYGPLLPTGLAPADYLTSPTGVRHVSYICDAKHVHRSCSPYFCVWARLRVREIACSSRSLHDMFILLSLGMQSTAELYMSNPAVQHLRRRAGLNGEHMLVRGIAGIAWNCRTLQHANST